MTTITTLTRYVTKRGKRVKEYRVRLTSKGRVTFVTPQWYSRLFDATQVTRALYRDMQCRLVKDPQGLLT